MIKGNRFYAARLLALTSLDFLPNGYDREEIVALPEDLQVAGDYPRKTSRHDNYSGDERKKRS